MILQGGGSSVAASDLSQNDRAVHVDFFNGMQSDMRGQVSLNRLCLHQARLCQVK
jgi:hypothetical protein